MSTRLVTVLGCSLIVGTLSCVSFAQSQGVAEKVGQRLDGVGRGLRREAENVSETLRKRFELMRTEVNKMGVPSRVYSRLRWDRALHGSKIEVHLLRGTGGVLLTGTVPDQVAKERAVALARDTVDVTEVVDELIPLATTTETTILRKR